MQIDFIFIVQIHLQNHLWTHYICDVQKLYFMLFIFDKIKTASNTESGNNTPGFGVMDFRSPTTFTKLGNKEVVIAHTFSIHCSIKRK